MSKLDGVLQLDAVADELVHESFVCDTRDHEDHTFCGVSDPSSTQFPCGAIPTTAAPLRR